MLGDLWTRIGSLAPVLRDQQLTFRGQSGRVGEDSAVRRVVRAGDFLRCEVRMDILGDVGTTEFAGLRLTPETQRGGSFQVELGLKSYGANRQPELRLVDGPPAREDSVVVKPLDVEFGTGQPVVLAVEFVQAIDATDKSLTLRVLWNGEQRRNTSLDVSRAHPWVGPGHLKGFVLPSPLSLSPTLLTQLN